LFEAEVVVSVWGNQKLEKGRSEEGRKRRVERNREREKKRTMDSRLSQLRKLSINTLDDSGE
jgi:hypothetical protein